MADVSFDQMQASVAKSLTQDYMNFKGRMSRFDFFSLWLFGLICSFIMLFLNVLFHVNIFQFIFALAFLLPFLGGACRRFHDIGLSALFALTLLIPFINLLVIIALLVMPSKTEGNAF